MKALVLQCQTGSGGHLFGQRRVIKQPRLVRQDCHRPPGADDVPEEPAEAAAET